MDLQTPTLVKEGWRMTLRDKRQRSIFTRRIIKESCSHCKFIHSNPELIPYCACECHRITLGE